MKRSEKYLNVLERLAGKKAREAERVMDTEHFEMRYQFFFVLSATPWFLIMLFVALVCHWVLEVLWLAVFCDLLAAILLYLLVDWASWRARVDETGITVYRLFFLRKRMERRAIRNVRLQGEKSSEAKKLILTDGNTELRFVSEMVGFELLFEWTKKR